MQNKKAEKNKAIIDAQEKTVTVLNKKYWNEIIPNIRATKLKIGFIPKKIQDEADKIYSKLQTERLRLTEIKNPEREVNHAMALFESAKLSIPR